MANDKGSGMPDNDIQAVDESNNESILSHPEAPQPPPTTTHRTTLTLSSALSSSNRSSITDGGAVSVAGIQPIRKEESGSGFSFKHFLRNSGDSSSNSQLNGSNPSPLAASPSSTITGTKPALRTSVSTNNNASNSNSTSSSSANQPPPPNLGARPKIPQYSLHNGGGLDQQQQQQQIQQQQQLPRMKRSPKFPSFDSHASLSEYSEEVSSSFVQRSHSNYEVETPSFSRRSPVVGQREGQIQSHQSSHPPLCNSPSGSGSGSRINSDFSSSGLPDFVKDHMVLEQWYQTNPFRSNDPSDLVSGGGPMGSSSPPMGNESGEMDPSSSMGRRNYHNSNLFDLAMGAGGGGGGNQSSFRMAHTNSPTVPLDLPTYDERVGIPLDLPHHRFNDLLSNHHHNHYHPSNSSSNNNNAHLPLDLTDRHRVNSRNDLREASPSSLLALGSSSPPPGQVQVDMMQTLPDFLSDGPIHSSGRMADVAQDLPQLDSPEENAAVNVISRLRLENERLRHELDEARRLISDQGRQVNELERTCRTGEMQRNGSVLERNKLNQKIAQLQVGVEREEEGDWREGDD